MTSDSRRNTSKPTAPHPDAILLWLMAEHTKAQARVEAADILLEAKPRNRLAEAKFERLCWTVSDIEDVILAQPAHTPEGLRIKARIAARYMQAPGGSGLAHLRSPRSLRSGVHVLDRERPTRDLQCRHAAIARQQVGGNSEGGNDEAQTRRYGSPPTGCLP